MIRFLPLTLLALGACFGDKFEEARDRDGDGFQAPEVGGTDCDDDNALVNPEAPEVCGDGVDNNCDGAADDAGFGNVTWYPDEDGDGFGADDPQQTCEAPADSVPNLVAGADCNDTNSAVNPSIVEQCGDGVDNDCNGVVDDSLDSVSYYVDNDQDGFPGGDLQNDCTAPQSSFPDLSVGEDCDDANVAVNPDAGEICGDGLDNDCDGATDDSGLGAVTWYVDSDNDGYPGPTAFSGCVAPNGSFATLSGGTDCNDLDASVSPAVAEIYYDGVDQNCDGANDYDADEDGEPSDAHGGADCDDTNASVRPTAIEVCNNGLDDDCSGDAPECAWEDGADIDDVAGTIWTSSDAIVDQLVTFESGTDGIDDLAVFVRGPRLDWVNGPFDQGTRSLVSVRSGRMTDSFSSSLTMVHSAIAVETANGLDGGIMFGVEGLNRVMHLTRPFPTFGVLGTSWSVVVGVENTDVGWALAGGMGMRTGGQFGWATGTTTGSRIVRNRVDGVYVWDGIPTSDQENDADRAIEPEVSTIWMDGVDVNADGRDDLLILEGIGGNRKSLRVSLSPQGNSSSSTLPSLLLDITSGPGRGAKQWLVQYDSFNQRLVTAALGGLRSSAVPVVGASSAVDGRLLRVQTAGSVVGVLPVGDYDDDGSLDAVALAKVDDDYELHVFLSLDTNGRTSADIVIDVQDVGDFTDSALGDWNADGRDDVAIGFESGVWVLYGTPYF